MDESSAARGWAWEEFGHAELGDVRRTTRLVGMAALAARRPGGKLLEVFQTSAERQGGYGFVGNDRVSCAALTRAMCEATAARSSQYELVYCAVDGSAVSVTDRAEKKGFGNVGSTAGKGRGLKVITAYAMGEDGAPIGVTSQQWWARASGKKRHDHAKRKASEKETGHWLNAITETTDLFSKRADAPRLWFVLDREADSQLCLGQLAALPGVYFTVRSSHDRRLVDDHAERFMRAEVRRHEPLGYYWIEVPGGHGRTGRRARIVVRGATMTVRLRDQWTNKITPMRLNVVEAREHGTVPRGEPPIEWRLLTNAPIEDFADAAAVVFSYVQRWGIEEFHKTWKSGACDIESSQLRKRDNLIRWATLLAAVAARIERLKVRSRTEPTLRADVELTEHEVRALILLKRAHKKKTETIPDDMPTLEQATLWIAELGGYTGKSSSGGPPGAITIRRGLEYIAPVALLLSKRAEEREI